MEIERGAVDTLGTPSEEGRETLVSEALRPAQSTHIWPQRLDDRDIAARIAAGLSNLTLIEAHEIVVAAEERLLAVFPAADIIIHPDPHGKAEPHGGHFGEGAH